MLQRYMESAFPTHKFDELIVKSEGEGAITVLNKIFGRTGWTYEVKSIQHGQQRTFAIVTLAIPGMVRDGCGFGKDAMEAIEVSLWSVLSQLKPVEPLVGKGETRVGESAPQPLPQPSEPLQPTPPAPQTEKKSMTYDEIIAGLMGKFKVNKPQAENLHKIRAKYQIFTAQQLLKYLQSWNSQITKVDDLNATNIDSFVEWANNNQPEGFAASTGV